MTEKALPTAGHSLADIARLLADKRLPPVKSWNPAYCGPIDMRIARDGTWYYLGTPIGRPAMVKLFSSILRREPDGSFVLVTPVEKVGIVVEDAPFLAVELFSEGEGEARVLGFRLNTDDHVIVDADHAVCVTVDPSNEQPHPTVHVRDGLRALIRRPVFYEMVELALHEKISDGPLCIWSHGVCFPIDGTAVQP